MYKLMLLYISTHTTVLNTLIILSILNSYKLNIKLHYELTPGAIGSGVNAKGFGPKAPCSHPAEVAR